MKQISQKMLRDADWRQVYQYDGDPLSFVVYDCPAIPGITITHERRKGSPKVRTYYTTGAHQTDSPFQAVRNFNDRVKRARTNGS